MRKLYLIFITFIYVSCSNNRVKCGGKEEIDTVKEIYKKELLKMNFAYKLYGINDMDTFIDSFMEENMKFELIRTTAINHDLESCDCSATLIFQLAPDISNFLDDRAKSSAELNNLLMSEITAKDGISIDYNLQPTDNGESFVAETFPKTEEVGQVLITYYLIYKAYQERKY